LVIEALCKGGEHLTIGDIQQYIQDHGNCLDESTIYRILQWLKTAEVISQTDLGSRGIVYELIGATPHHHLICLSCEAVIGLDDSVGNLLREKLRHDYGFEARVDHLAIFGWCQECAEQREADHSPE
jgi:Fur family transcriptional regulator, ferric uptake regulator